ncbi:MAG: TIGR03435 family protein, partial [Acidobacteriales bacterium]|nr:TIGR03435 family protein [Terriglobales bacterium]
MTRFPSLLACTLALAIPFCSAQTPAPVANIKFEVVVIKPTPPGSTGNSLNFNQGKMVAHNIPLKDVIKFAYDLKSDSQLLNAPDWVKTDRYEIDAQEDEAESAALMKMAFEGRFAVLRQMMRQMLVERFHLEATPQT